MEVGAARQDKTDAELPYATATEKQRFEDVRPAFCWRMLINLL